MIGLLHLASYRSLVGSGDPLITGRYLLPLATVVRARRRLRPELRAPADERPARDVRGHGPARPQPRRADAHLRAVLWVERRVSCLRRGAGFAALSAGVLPDQAARGDRVDAVGLHRAHVPLALPAGSRGVRRRGRLRHPLGDRPLRRDPVHGQHRASPLEVTARGYAEGEYRSDYRSTYRVAGRMAGLRQLDVAADAADARRRSAMLCVRNLGDQSIDLVGSEDGRAYSRPTVRVDGDGTTTELQLRLLQSGPAQPAVSGRPDDGARRDAEAVRGLVVVGAVARADDA